MRKQHTLTVLVKHLARIAQTISDLIATNIEQDAASIALRAAYRQCSEISRAAMTSAEFADMASQLLVYSCFVARYYHKEPISFQRQHISGILSYAHPLHRQCVEAIFDMESGCAAIAGCIDEMVRLLASLDRESVDSGFQDDPLTHFYELFLSYYNPRLRASHGIFYTPEPVVSYMVRSIEQLLRSRFGCRDGLGEVDADMRILDPACGTGVFVQATLERMRAAYQRDGQAELWREHLHQYFLPRLSGIEVLITPYLIAHFRLNLFLADADSPEHGQLGLEPGRGQERPDPEPGRGQARPVPYTNRQTMGVQRTGRACPRPGNVPGPFSLGNALIGPDTQQQDSPSPIMIVLGNPPYAGHSANREAWMLSLLDEYKEGCPELQKRAQAKWLSDDYVKFMRLAQWRIDRAGQGILAFITSHSYLDNPTFRGMRHSLMRSFDELFVLDLHGNSKKQELSPGETKDENVFAIQPGVAISIFVKKGNRSHCKGVGGEDVGRGPLRSPSSFSSKAIAQMSTIPQPLRSPSSSILSAETTAQTPTIYHAQLWGNRVEKLSWLSSHDLESTTWTIQHPQAPHYLFAPQETHYFEEYEAGWSLPAIFRPNGDPAPGIITCHDEFAVAWSRDEAMRKVERLLATRDEEEARQCYRLCAQEQWNYAAAKRALSDGKWREQLTPVLYRPFDTRWTVYNRHVAVHLRERVTRHMLPGEAQGGRENLALLIGKAGQVISQQTWDIVFCSRIMTEFNLFRRGGNNIFPLYLASNDRNDGQANRDVNLAPDFIADVISCLGLRWVAEGRGDLRQSIGPEAIFSYMYALLHAPTYRARYAAFLKRDFPRIPLTSNLALFRALCGMGEKLVRLHLMEDEERFITYYPVQGTHQIEHIRYVLCEDDETMGRVWINATHYFENVPLAVWTWHIGGYQVCLKWLKDRMGRILSREEMAHYQNIVAVLAETIALMEGIDGVIEQTGGWPL